MIDYDLLGDHISMLRDVLRSLYILDLDKCKVAEIVMIGHAIDSLNQSIECLTDLGGTK